MSARSLARAALRVAAPAVLGLAALGHGAARPHALAQASALDAADPVGSATLFLPLSLRFGDLAGLPAAATLAPPTATLAATVPPPTATDLPPTAPPSPTAPEPTDEPPTPEPPTATAEPTATPTKAAPLACAQLVTNGGFEEGARDWSLRVTGTEQAASLAINHRSRVNLAPFGGDWLAWLGGLDQTTFELTSTRLAGYRPADVVSATLSLAVAVVTQERRDRRPDDRAVVYARTPGRQAIPGASFSEETVPEDYRWAPVRLDVTDVLSARRVDALEVALETDGSGPTWFYVDEIALEVCTPAAP